MATEQVAVWEAHRHAVEQHRRAMLSFSWVRWLLQVCSHSCKAALCTR